MSVYVYDFFSFFFLTGSYFKVYSTVSSFGYKLICLLLFFCLFVFGGLPKSLDWETICYVGYKVHFVPDRESLSCVTRSDARFTFAFLPCFYKEAWLYTRIKRAQYMRITLNNKYTKWAKFIKLESFTTQWSPFWFIFLNSVKFGSRLPLQKIELSILNIYFADARKLKSPLFLI